MKGSYVEVDGHDEMTERLRRMEDLGFSVEAKWCPHEFLKSFDAPALMLEMNNVGLFDDCGECASEDARHNYSEQLADSLRAA